MQGLEDLPSALAGVGSLDAKTNFDILFGFLQRI
jgi:hypothetical protein